jgi:hypothetical protein
MSHEWAEFEGDELLRATGRVPAPEPRVLEDARGVLWSAVAREMLGLGPAGEHRTTTGESTGGEEADRRTARRRQAARSPDERKTAMGGGDPQA